jgi:predicted nuclease of predicted toxin-antitoxin system
MKFLADENVPGPVIDALRQDGLDVTWIRDDASGLPDALVLARAQQEARVLITFDKDFGELARRLGLSAAAGVILFRIPTRSPQEAAEMVARTIRTSKEWAGRFSVVTPNGIRTMKE